MRVRTRIELTDVQEAIAEHLGQLTEVARLAGLPIEWRICPSCSEQSWVLDPHGGSPCPLNLAVAENFGLKLDAERMAAIRSGVSLDTFAKDLLDRLVPPDDDSTQ